ncbi:MAG: thiamine phosphate synthase [Pyrinomonadaceae bacterium]
MIFERFSKDNPAIYLITDGSLNSANYTKKSAGFLETIRFAVASEINLIQIREKNLPAKLLYEIAAKSAEITRNSQTKILINDRADIAWAAGADGVHLTSDSVSAKIIRQKFPLELIIGISVHSLKEAEIAKAQKADFVTFSPIFDTPSKAFYGKPQGLIKLREVCEKLKPFPVFALGGIDETNLFEVLNCGAIGYAAIRYLNEMIRQEEI